MEVSARCQYCNSWLDDRFDADVEFGNLVLNVYPCEYCLRKSYEEGVAEGRDLEKNDM